MFSLSMIAKLEVGTGSDFCGSRPKKDLGMCSLQGFVVPFFFHHKLSAFKLMACMWTFMFQIRYSSFQQGPIELTPNPT